jgi:hypothetical protein
MKHGPFLSSFVLLYKKPGLRRAALRRELDNAHADFRVHAVILPMRTVICFLLDGGIVMPVP